MASWLEEWLIIVVAVKRLLKIAIVALALTALASYVIYSQRRHTPRVAPGSKAGIAADTLKKIDQQVSTWTNNAERSETNKTGPARLAPTKPAMVAPGSESAPVGIPLQ